LSGRFVGLASLNEIWANADLIGIRDMLLRAIAVELSEIFCCEGGHKQ